MVMDSWVSKSGTGKTPCELPFAIFQYNLAMLTFFELTPCKSTGKIRKIMTGSKSF